MAAAGRLPNYKSNLMEQVYAEMIWLVPQAQTRVRTLDRPEMIRLVPQTRTQDGTLHSF